MSQQQSREQAVTDALEDFASARGRPALLLGLVDSLDLEHAVQVQQLLGDTTHDELDLVIHSPGGSIHAAYQIVEVLRLRADAFFACVPLYAKSAATLLCVGADAIHMDELAQLGPLDTQISEEKKGGKREYTSALNPFKTLEQLQEFALETLDLATKMIASRSDMDLDECLGHSTDFVAATAGPLFSRLDPEKLGTYSRALSVGEEYAKRLLTRFSSMSGEQIEVVTHTLVHGYPAHDYIIDFQEVEDLGLPVRLFDRKEQGLARALLSLIVRHRTSSVLLAHPRSIDETGFEEGDDEDIGETDSSDEGEPNVADNAGPDGGEQDKEDGDE